VKLKFTDPPAVTVGLGGVIETAFPVSVNVIAPGQPASPAAGEVIPAPASPTFAELAVHVSDVLVELAAFANVGLVA